MPSLVGSEMCIRDSLTIALWVKAKSFSNPKWNDLFRKEGSWAIQADTSGKFNFEITSKADTVSTVAIPANTWTHVAVTFEGTTVKFYKNGVLGDTKTQTIIPNAGLNTIDIGGYTSWGTYLNGALDEIKIYNRALSAAEIKAVYLSSGTSTTTPVPTVTPAPAKAPIPQATPTPVPTVTPAPAKAPIPQATTAPAPTGALIFDGSFHYGDHWIGRNSPFGNWGYTCLPRSDSLTVVSAPGGRTGYVGKFKIYPGDVCNTDSGGNRAMAAKLNTGEREGMERYYGFSVFFEPGFQAAPGYPLVWQIHDTVGNPNVALTLQKTVGKINIMITGGSSTSARINTPILDIAPGTWHDIIVRVKWSTSNNGLVEVYQKSGATYNRMYSNIGPTLKIGQSHNIEQAIGLYRAQSLLIQTLYFGNYKVSTTRGDVEYRG